MKFSKLSIPDVILITPTVFGDDRGYFFEVFHEDKFGVNFPLPEIAPIFVQDNQAFSTKGVVRGLHFQKECPQGKLVRCIKGTIIDVAVDIRPNSPTDFYHPEDEGGIKWDDPALGIDWNVTNPIVSDKDQILPLLSEM